MQRLWARFFNQITLPGSSIPIIVSTGIRIVVLTMMVSMPAVPAIFFRLTVISVTRVILTIVVRSLISRAYVNVDPFIRF